MLKYEIPKDDTKQLQYISTCVNEKQSLISDIISDNTGSLVTIEAPKVDFYLETEYQIFKGLASKNMFPTIVDSAFLNYVNEKLPSIRNEKDIFNDASLNATGNEQDEFEEKYQLYAMIENEIYKLNKGL